MEQTRGRRRVLFAMTAALSATALLIAAGAASATGALDANNLGPATDSFSFAAESYCGKSCDPAEGSGYRAQTFTALTTGALDTVQVQVWRNAAADLSVLGDLEIRIEGTGSGLTAGLPNSEVLATQTIQASSVSTEANAVITVVFDEPASVEAGNQYAIVFAAAGGEAGGPGDDYYWAGATGDDYSGGTWCFQSGEQSGWDSGRCAFPLDAVFATFVTPAPSADVAVSIAGPDSAKRGAQVTYVITVSNAGPDSAHNVVLSNPVPAGATFVAATTTAGSCTGPRVGRTGPISCALGDLASGNNAVSSTTVKVTAKIGSTIATVASAKSTDDGAGLATLDPQASNNTASLITKVTK